MADLMDLLPVAPVPQPTRPPSDPPPPAPSPAIQPAFRFIPSPAPMLGQRWLDTFEIARLYAEAAQRNLIAGVETTRLDPAVRVTPGQQARG